MSTQSVTHYTAYKSRPFLRHEREKVTLLYGGLNWKHERVLQGAAQNLNYRAQPLPNVSREDLDTGKELVDVGACCPTTFTTGNLVNFLKSEAEKQGTEQVANNYVYLTAGACGACRFGQYHQSYAMALDALGLKDFRIFVMAQDDMDQGSMEGGGLDINVPFSTALYWAALCADLMTDLEYMTRPYEVVLGQTDQVLRDSIEHLYEVFRNRPVRGKKWRILAFHLLGDYFTGALRQVKKKWESVEVDRLTVKPKVDITGEFWVQIHEGDGNYNIKKWLEQEGAEVIVPPIAVWFDYLIRFYAQGIEARKGVERHAFAKLQAVKAGQWIFRFTYNRLRKALGNVPYEMPDQSELRRLAAPFYHHQLSGGEGDMLIGKALHAYHHKKAHMICELSPYSCLPNTMSIGAMSQVLGKYPDLLYAPIEIKGDAEVHALSRCQMILTEARKRAQQEFETVLEETGVSLDQLRRYQSEHPEVKSATYRVPHHGFACTAANYAYELASRM